VLYPPTDNGKRSEMHLYSVLERFSPDETAPIANQLVGKIESLGISESCFLLFRNKELLDISSLADRIREWRRVPSREVSELIWLLHTYAPDPMLAKMAGDADLYAASVGPTDNVQAMFTMMGLSDREFEGPDTEGADAAFLQILRILSDTKNIDDLRPTVEVIETYLERRKTGRKPPRLPQNAKTWDEFVSLSRIISENLSQLDRPSQRDSRCIRALKSWTKALERAIIRRTQSRKPRKITKLKNRRRNRR
jgi:hypothetical protein